MKNVLCLQSLLKCSHCSSLACKAQEYQYLLIQKLTEILLHTQRWTATEGNNTRSLQELHTRSMPPILGVNQAGFETEQKAAELIFTLVIFFFFFTVVSAQLKNFMKKKKNKHTVCVYTCLCFNQTNKSNQPYNIVINADNPSMDAYCHHIPILFNLSHSCPQGGLVQSRLHWPCLIQLNSSTPPISLMPALQWEGGQGGNGGPHESLKGMGGRTCRQQTWGKDAGMCNEDGYRVR